MALFSRAIFYDTFPNNRNCIKPLKSPKIEKSLQGPEKYREGVSVVRKQLAQVVLASGVRRKKEDKVFVKHPAICNAQKISGP